MDPEALVSTEAQEVTLSDVKELADTLNTVVNEIKLYDSKIKDLNKMKTGITHEKLPELMKLAGLNEIKTDDGKKFTMDKWYNADIKSSPKEVFDWLDNNDSGSIAKQVITIDVDPKDVRRLKDIKEVLEANEIEYNSERAVHHMTLKTFIRECVENNIELPDYFNASYGDWVKIK